MSPVVSLLTDFVVAKTTPTLESNLGYKLFFMFGVINIAGMAVFSLFDSKLFLLLFVGIAHDTYQVYS